MAHHGVDMAPRIVANHKTAVMNDQLMAREGSISNTESFQEKLRVRFTVSLGVNKRPSFTVAARSLPGFQPLRPH